MKSRVATLLLLLGLVLPVHAGERDLASLLRPHRVEIAQFLSALVERRVAINVAAALSEKGFTEAQIGAVLSSDEFRIFAHRVTDNSEVKQMLHSYLEEVLGPANPPSEVASRG